MLGRAVQDKELAPICVFAFVGHGYRPTAKRMAQWAVEFVAEGFTPAAGAALSCTGWVATLDHEIADVAVEESGGVVAPFGKLDEVPDRLGREFGEEFEVEDAEGGTQACVAGGFHAPRVEHVVFV